MNPNLLCYNNPYNVALIAECGECQHNSETLQIHISIHSHTLTLPAKKIYTEQINSSFKSQAIQRIKSIRFKVLK